jgi:hypothetical protein
MDVLDWHGVSGAEWVGGIARGDRMQCADHEIPLRPRIFRDHNDGAIGGEEVDVCKERH